MSSRWLLKAIHTLQKSQCHMVPDGSLCVSHELWDSLYKWSQINQTDHTFYVAVQSVQFKETTSSIVRYFSEASDSMCRAVLQHKWLFIFLLPLVTWNAFCQDHNWGKQASCLTWIPIFSIGRALHIFLSHRPLSITLYNPFNIKPLSHLAIYNQYFGVKQNLRLSVPDYNYE